MSTLSQLYVLALELELAGEDTSEVYESIKIVEEALEIF